MLTASYHYENGDNNNNLFLYVCLFHVFIADKVSQFDSSDVYKFYKEDILDNEDENEDDDDTLSPFEKMAAKMESIVPDRGVLKQMLHQGTGDIVPPGAHVIGNTKKF